MRFFSRSFLLLWHGQVISQLGNQAFLIAAAFLALDATGSTTVVAAVMMASTTPLVILGPIGGTVADRHSRRRLVIATDLSRGLTIGAFAALIWFRPDITFAHVAALILVAGCNGTMAAIFMPAVQAIIPDLVERDRLASANSLTQFSNQAAVLVGQAIGGVMYLHWGATGLLAFDAVSFGYAAVATWFVPADSSRRHHTGTLSASIKTYLVETASGLTYLRAQPGMPRLLLTFGAVNFLFMPVFVLLPVYVRTSLAAGAEWYGFLLAGAGAGALAGAALAGTVLARHQMNAQAVATCIAVIAGAMLTVSAASAPGTALVAFVIIGMCSAVINVVVMTMFHAGVPSEFRGRVMALVVALSAAATPLGMVLGGVMGDLWRNSLRGVFAACAVATLAVALVAHRGCSWPSRHG